MGKKKRGRPDVEEILGRPWCYYCERDFDDQKVLINHQKAKHFKCERCGRRLNTAGGLSVHMSQVHKETLSAVDNALPNRAGLDIEIFGMEGIPEDIIQQHSQRVLTQFHQAEADRRAGSTGQGGAAASGSATGNQAKKPKFEAPSDLKKRLAEHKAKLAAEQANGGTSGGGTPLGAGSLQSPATVVASPMYVQQQQQPLPQQSFGGLPGSSPFPLIPGYSPAVPGLPLQQGAVSYHPQMPFSPPPFQDQVAHVNTQFSPQMLQPSQPLFPGLSPGAPVSIPPRPFGAGSPVQHFGFQQQQPVRLNTPPQAGLPPQRSLSGTFSPAPGLPQRPAFGAPHVNHFQMQQMHQGQLPAGLPNAASTSPVPGSNAQQGNLPLPTDLQVSSTPVPSGNETSLDDLISGASKQAQQAVVPAAGSDAIETAEKPATKPREKGADESLGEKRDKKDKSKASHLVYSDQDVSPEEKMATMPRYAFIPAAVS